MPMSSADEPLTFFSSQVEMAEDKSVVIALFDGELRRVDLLRCSRTAALNLVIAIAGCLISDNEPQAPNDS